MLISKTLWWNLGAPNGCSQNWPEWTPPHSFSGACMLCTEISNTYLLNDVKTKQFIISHEEDMNENLKNLFSKSWSLFTENLEQSNICKPDLLGHV